MQERERKPYCPRGLGRAAQSFWHDAVSQFTFNAAEFRLLEQAARTLDEISDMEKSLAQTGPLIPGSTGQLRINPIIAALQSHRKVFDQLVVALALPTDTEATGRRRSAQAKQAAGSRWRKTKSNTSRISHLTSPNRSA